MRFNMRKDANKVAANRVAVTTKAVDKNLLQSSLLYIDMGISIMPATDPYKKVIKN